MRKWVFIHAFVAIIILIRVANLSGGEWHIGSSLVCSECHTIHYGEGQGGEPGGPFPYLLSYSTINGLCFSCHDGRD
ncbi:MAG: hypothetical protein ACE5K2_07330, partial [Candidatus Zixiibacteriota bacterium]